MKRRFSAFLLILLTMAMTGACGAFAEVVENEMGLYTDYSADPSATSISISPGLLFNIHLIVTDPCNYSFAPSSCDYTVRQSIDWVSSFYTQIFMPEDGFLVVGVDVNGGEAGHQGNPPEYSYGLEPLSGIQVPESRILRLLTFTCMVLDSEPKEIYFGPSQYGDAETLMVGDAGGDRCDARQAVYPSSGSFDLPVFGINKTVVATDGVSWDGVKSLYK